MQRLILIDGNAIFHRAYHALPNFTNSDGAPVGAIFGFTSMLLKIFTELKPTHIIATFDRSTPTFRKQLYVGYQANRPTMGVDLSDQFEGVYSILKAFDIPMFAVDGYEADDVIGTLARQAVEDKSFDGEVIIVTGDRDLMQLVNKRVSVFTPIKGLTEAKLYDEKGVCEKFSIAYPLQLIDLKALMGDASDNYPGVAGIGPKTAAELITKYETLENVYNHLGELKPRTAQLLAEGAESAGIGKKLATIVSDVPITIDFKKCLCESFDKKAIVAALQAFEFRTLTNRFLEMVGEKPLAEAPSKLKETKKKDDDNQLRLV